MTMKNDNYYIIYGNLNYPLTKIKKEIEFINKQLECNLANTRYTLHDIDKFLKITYYAEKIELKEINNCTKNGIKRYNKHCKSVECISEGFVSDNKYVGTYKILRNNMQTTDYYGDCFIDTVIIIGSDDNVHPTDFYIGGGSKKLGLQMNILCSKIKLE